jgi:hypothetical protein
VSMDGVELNASVELPIVRDFPPIFLTFLGDECFNMDISGTPSVSCNSCTNYGSLSNMVLGHPRNCNRECAPFYGRESHYYNICMPCLIQHCRRCMWYRKSSCTECIAPYNLINRKLNSYDRPGDPDYEKIECTTETKIPGFYLHDRIFVICRAYCIECIDYHQCTKC